MVSQKPKGDEMCEMGFKQDGSIFVIVAEDWGDMSGATAASIHLKLLVRSLPPVRTRALYEALVHSDGAFGDDPCWQSASMLEIYSFQEDACRVGVEVSEDGLNDGHGCRCRLLPGVDEG